MYVGMKRASLKINERLKQQLPQMANDDRD